MRSEVTTLQFEQPVRKQLWENLKIWEKTPDDQKWQKRLHGH